MPHAVLFDLDGVLVESFEVWLEVVRAAVRDLGDGSEVTRGEFVATWGQSVQADVAQWFPRASVAQLDAYYQAHFMEHAQHLQVNPEAAGLVGWLARRGLSRAVVTNTPAPLARRILERASLDFDVVVGGTDVPRAKPAPDMVLRALELLGTPASAAVMIGDTDNDRRAARGAAVRFVGLGLECEERIERLSDLRALLEAGSAR